MFCPKCGKQISDMSKFCMRCGCSIEEYDVNENVVTETVNEKTQSVPVENKAIEVEKQTTATSDGISKLEAEKQRREAAAQMQINNYKKNESIGKTLKRRQRKAMLPVFIFILIIALACGGIYAYKNGYSAKGIFNTAKAKVMLVLGISTPESTVSAYCNAIRLTDSEAMIACYVEGYGASAIEEDTDEYTKAFYDYIAGLNKEIKYEIVDSSTDGDKAIVSVRFEYKDASNVFKEVLLEYTKEMLSKAFSLETPSEEEMEELLISILNNKIETIIPNDISDTINIECRKVDKKWYISSLTPQMTNVATANMYRAFEEIAESLNSAY